MSSDGGNRLAKPATAERYYAETGSDRPPRWLVRVIADMVEAAMNRAREKETGEK